MKIGVLAVQGDFDAHRSMLESLGVDATEVRNAADFVALDGIVLPGGESTTQLKFLEEEGLSGPLRRFAAEGGAMFGTCAGAILLAREVRNPAQPSLGLMDISVLRNGYGRQLSSEVRFGHCTLKPAPLEMVFIRAPIIERVGPGVEVLAEEGGTPVLVRQGRLLASTFHPELTHDSTVHSCFLALAEERLRAVTT
jgi:pyridoxal 5'-phosphate synthase pdxT subunit